MAPGERVLVVDDDPVLRHATARTLERAGLEVAQAGSVAAALAILEKAAPAAILSDLALPGQSGLDLLVRTRESPRLRAVGLVLWSGSGPLSGGALRTLDELGIEYVEKPAPAERLLAALDRAIARARVAT